MKIILALLFVFNTFAQQKTVYVAYIDGEIDLGLAPYAVSYTHLTLPTSDLV